MTSNIHPESALLRIPKAIVSQKVVIDGKRTDVKSYTPLHQTQIRRGRIAYQTTSFKGVPQNLFTGNNRYVGQLQQGSLSSIKSVTLKVSVQVVRGTGRLVEATDWFDRVK